MVSAKVSTTICQMKCTSRTRSKSALSSEGACHRAKSLVSAPTFSSTFASLWGTSQNLPIASDGQTLCPSKFAASHRPSKWSRLVRCQSGSHVPRHHRSSSNTVTSSSTFPTVLLLALGCALVLFSLPNLSHSFRVPYRYPNYPLFHKELLQGSPGRRIFFYDICTLLKRFLFVGNYF